MLNRIARHTWLNCVLFLAAYTILFAVQLHFKYSICHKNNAGLDLDASVVRYSSAKWSADRKIDINYKSNKLNIKVSKRYQHKTIFEIPLVTIPELRVFTSQEALLTISSVRLCHSTLISSHHRGPPAIG